MMSSLVLDILVSVVGISVFLQHNLNIADKQLSQSSVTYRPLLNSNQVGGIKVSTTVGITSCGSYGMITTLQPKVLMEMHTR